MGYIGFADAYRRRSSSSTTKDIAVNVASTRAALLSINGGEVTAVVEAR